MLPCFDTKSVKITHFHLFIKEIILLFIHLRKIFQNISQNFDKSAYRILHNEFPNSSRKI